MAGFKIPTHKKQSINDIKNYHKPKYVYIPLIVRNDINITALVKKDSYVYKGMIIGKTKDKEFFPIISSVSGFVVDIIEKKYMDNKLVNCIKIENDFKEQREQDNIYEITDYTKEQFLDTLRTCGIVGLGGASFPTYLKYKTATKIKTLIINAVECEPYITADYMTALSNMEEILEAIDAVMEINKIDECFIGIKNYNTKLKEQINKYIGTYPKIKTHEVPNKYPMGWERTLVKQIKNVTYETFPIEKNIIVNNISTMFTIYEALKHHYPLTERIITVTGEMVKKPTNINVKIGTDSKEILEYIGLKRYTDIILVAGGPMMGEAISDDFIISNNLNCLLILKNKELFNEQICLRCSKCINVCPSNLKPVLIKDNIENEEVLNNLDVFKCIECGLCSYICPSNIRVRNYCVKAKQLLRKEE